MRSSTAAALALPAILLGLPACSSSSAPTPTSSATRLAVPRGCADLRGIATDLDKSVREARRSDIGVIFLSTSADLARDDMKILARESDEQVARLAREAIPLLGALQRAADTEKTAPTVRAILALRGTRHLMSAVCPHIPSPSSAIWG